MHQLSEHPWLQSLMKQQSTRGPMPAHLKASMIQRTDSYTEARLVRPMGLDNGSPEEVVRQLQVGQRGAAGSA